MNIIVERDKEELVIPGSSRTVTRPARFLNPSLSSSTTTTFDVPLSALRRKRNLSPKNISFRGWKGPIKDWNDWVDRMLPLHRATWQKAGIHQAILSSTYSLPPCDKDLVFYLAMYWCPVTNSFVFRWGEATVTLEDVLLLGGYSVIGDSVLDRPVGDCDKDLVRIDEELMQVRREMNVSSSKKTTFKAWMEHFMGKEKEKEQENEHEAFLVLWLSKHVFPFANDVVGRHLHQVAIRLARGERIALAPAVLASIYRDLGSLREAVVGKGGDGVAPKLWAPMHLVQIWAWERFTKLRPETNPVEDEMELPRMVFWNNVKTKNTSIKDVRSAIDNADDDRGFVWRPYAASVGKNSELYKFYPVKDKWVQVCPGMRDDFRSLARFLRVSELVSINNKCIESYFPHRVSLQFGFDQDIPCAVTRFDQTPEIAWNNYARTIRDEKLYVPCRVLESGVTSRYSEWWNQWNFVEVDDAKNSKVTARKAMKLQKETRNNKPRTSVKEKKIVIDDKPTPSPSPDTKRAKSVSKIKATKSRKEMVDDDDQRPEKIDTIHKDEGSSPSTESQMVIESTSTSGRKRKLGKAAIYKSEVVKAMKLHKKKEETNSQHAAVRIERVPLESRGPKRKLDKAAIYKSEIVKAMKLHEKKEETNSQHAADGIERLPLEVLRTWPLESRFTRLELLTAMLQEEDGKQEKVTTFYQLPYAARRRRNHALGL